MGRARATASKRPVARGSRWTLLFPVVLLLALPGALWQYLHRPGQLPLREVEITGEFTWLDPAAVRQRVSEVVQGRAFFDVDLLEVSRQVGAMPWVGQVSVRRVWPDTLRMEVTEQVPLAYWNRDALVNLDGQVFRPAEIPDLGPLPYFSGGERDAPRLVAFYLQLHSRLLDRSLRIGELRLDRRGDWTVIFRNGPELVLGHEDIAERQRVFLELYPRLLQYGQRPPARIDMRYEHGFAVRWQQQKAGES